MRVLVVGATGTIGRAVVAGLQGRHEVVPAHRRGKVRVDLADPGSIALLYHVVGRVDAVVSCAGDARFGPLAELKDDDFAYSLANKLMGQVNLVRLGFAAVSDGGSFTLTSGILARKPSPGSAAISLVNGGLEAFVGAATLEAPRGIRVNVVSPPWVSETLAALQMDPAQGLPAATVARAYVRSVEGTDRGAVLQP